MSSHGQKQQKKLAKKKAKREGKRHVVAQRATTGIESLLRHAGEWPIVEAMVPKTLWQRGMGQLVIARQMPDGAIAFAVFLVDTYCLGVKDAFCDIRSRYAYREFIDQMEQVGLLEPVRPESFAKLITEAVAYAQAIGLPPHADYGTARLLLAGIDPSLSTDQYEFGQDGKPFYIQGPYDSPARSKLIAQKLGVVGGEFVLVREHLEDLEELGDLDDGHATFERVES